MTTTTIEVGIRITAESGAWATLRYDPNGGTYYSGVYWAEAWAGDFPADITSHTLISHRSRARVERAMRSWLANR